MRRWIIIPESAPAVVRNCGNCGGTSRFVCSGKFRVNANGNQVDVWLIYHCERCGKTWNMEVASRVQPRRLGGELLERFSQNDPALARRCAFDAGLLGKNKARLCLESVGCHIRKEEAAGPPELLEVVAPSILGMRLDKLLSEGTGYARSQIQELIRTGVISGVEGPVSPKTKCRERLLLKGVPDGETIIKK